MITHLFYHQETVENQCAVNSWLSIRNWFGKDDEVIILDIGNTLKDCLPIETSPKYLRIEKIRTDTPQERSYTFGLNAVVPFARYEWVVIWRSDYIYHKEYYKALREGMKRANVVLPYEAFVGIEYCNYRWCKKRLKLLRTAEEDFLLAHSIVCPMHESMDYAHFAIKKALWLKVGGMNEKLFGYGFQFPELFSRLKKLPEFCSAVQFEMFAFHQLHWGSFAKGAKKKKLKRAEARQSRQKLIALCGSEKAAEDLIRSFRQPPLRPRRPEEFYKAKPSILGKVKWWTKQISKMST